MANCSIFNKQSKELVAIINIPIIKMDTINTKTLIGECTGTLTESGSLNLVSICII